MDSDIAVTDGNISAKNVSDFRTHNLGASNNISFYNMWKNLVRQNRTFNTNTSQIQERLFLHSADDSSVVVQKLVKRDTEEENADSVTTMTEMNSVSEHGASHRDGGEHEGCLDREYIVYTWVLCLVALATALKLYYLVKTTLATAMVSIFTTLILVACNGTSDKEWVL